MSNFVRAAQARINSIGSMVVFDETTAIMREIIRQSDLNEFSATVDDTTMTTSSKTITVTGSSAATDITNGDTLILNGTTITLGTSGVSLNAVIGDINDADLDGISATKTVDNKIEISYTTDLDSVFTIGAGTANAALGLTDDDYDTDLPLSTDYHDAWVSATISAARINEMNAVITFFENIGYTIIRQEDSNQQTFSWKITW